MHSLMAKTGCSNRAEIAALAMSAGLLPELQGMRETADTDHIVVQMDGLGVRHLTLPKRTGQAQQTSK
jgi:hypothetical protein